MYHLAAYTATIGPTADTDVAALSDDILTIQNSHFVLQQPMLLLAAAAMSATLLRAKLASPTLRQIANPWIRPIIGAAIPGNNANLAIYGDNPLHLPPFQELQVLATSGVAMTERFTGLVFLADIAEPNPAGDMYPVRATSTTAATANAWTTLSLTWQDTLPPGVYSMLFSEHQSSNGIAHRWIFPNQLYRPGLPSLSAVTQRLPYASYGLPKMGTFRSNALPLLQVLCNGADATHEVYAWVVKTGNLT